MNTKTILIAFLGLLIGAVAVFMACGGGGDDDDATGDDDVGQGQPGQIQAYVRDFQTKQPVQGATVEALNDDTGAPFDPPITAVSPSDGSVTLEIPEGIEKIGIKVTKDTGTDTVQYHFDVGVEGEEFLLVSNSTKELVALGLGLTIDTTKAMVAGGVYWWEPANENGVGCGWVTFSDDPDGVIPVYYFGPDALPTLDRNPPAGKTPSNQQGTSPLKDGKGHAISYYVSINREIATDLTVYGNVFDTQGATIDETLTPEQSEAIVPAESANTVTIVNVYYGKDEYPANPTPSWCTQ